MNQDRVVLGLVIIGVIFGAGYYVSGHLPASAANIQRELRPTTGGQQFVSQRYTKSPDKVVREFYSVINDRRYADAYAMMSSSFRSRASLAHFSEGYQTTRRVSFNVDGTSGSIVKATVHAADDQANGALRERTFVGQWSLMNEGGRWYLSTGNFSTVADSNEVQIARKADSVTTIEPQNHNSSSDNSTSDNSEGTAAADQLSKDMEEYNTCASNSDLDYATLVSRCTPSVAYFARRVDEESGETKEDMLYNEFACSAIEGISELGLGETILGKAHLVSAESGLKTFIVNSNNQEFINRAESIIATMERIVPSE